MSLILAYGVETYSLTRANKKMERSMLGVTLRHKIVNGWKPKDEN